LAQLRAAGVAAGRISRDDVRRALRLVPGATTVADEAAVTAIQHAWIAALFAAGVDVVLVDDTHLTDQRLAVTGGLAASCAATLEVVDLRDVAVDVCVTRDSGRPCTERVGAGRIRELAADAGLPSGRRNGATS
jgi:hypothetical protein